MKIAFLTVGQRASGKSTYCEKVIQLDPELILISRDQILMELFGRTSLNPYMGGHFAAAEVMWKRMAEVANSKPDIKLILDCWNCHSDERKELIKDLKIHGFTVINALYFVTPAHVVEKWFWQKPGIAKASEMRKRYGQGLSFYMDDAPFHDHAAFHNLASDIKNDGFDKIIRIDASTATPTPLS